ncbi:leucine dehydrogenase [Nocardioides panzhihuensis]|uniref:Leucine dehydrogenase n=2 Tax=Nocardioides panzhihuensis TaxID=860243 RepID=A0A7Z0DK05_9ACTN|nr:leucine dehydrogenase [Nocardioides panzhihuensis]
MTEKCLLAGLPHGGGKAVVMDPGTLHDADVRHLVLEDLADVITGLGGTYITGPDIGSTPEDMDIIHQMTGGLSFCRPEASGGSGNSSDATAQGVIAALVAGAEHVFSTSSLAGLRAGIIGYGSVGSLIAESLASRGCVVTVAEANQQRRRDVEAAGVAWAQGDLLEEDLDILVPAAIGGLLSPESARACRARLIVGPANNQLTDEGVASILHDNGTTWVPDVVASAGGIIHAVCREEMGLDERETAGRIAAIGATTAEILAESRDLAITPQATARNIAARRQKEVA